MTSPMYRCSDCKKKYSHEPIRREKHEQHMACKFLTEKPIHQYRATHRATGNPGVKYRSCIGNYYDGQWGAFINSYKWYEKGIFPYPGSFFEQPSKYVEAMSLVETLMEEDAKRKEDTIKRARNGRRSKS